MVNIVYSYFIFSVVITCFIQNLYSFDRVYLKTNYHNFYIPTNIINNTFSKRTIFKRVEIEVATPKELLHELFNDLPKALKIANKYARQKMQLRNTTNKYDQSKISYWGFDGHSTYAEIYPLVVRSNQSNSEFIYYCESSYKSSSFTLSGRFIMNVYVLKQTDEMSLLIIDSYFHLKNKFYAAIAHLFLNNQGSLGQNITYLIDSSIKYMAKIGRISVISYRDNEWLQSEFNIDK